MTQQPSLNTHDPDIQAVLDAPLTPYPYEDLNMRERAACDRLWDRHGRRPLGTKHGIVYPPEASS